MNRNKAEKIAALVLLGILVIIFVIQNAHALSATCHGYTDKSIDNGKCLKLEKTAYQFRYYVGKQVDDSCESTAPAHADQYIKGYTDAYNGAGETIRAVKYYYQI